jgi:hypothetical protein
MSSRNENTPMIDSDVEAVHAFARLKPRRDALTPAELAKPNVDITHAVGVVLKAERRIVDLLPEIEKVLPAFDTRIVRELRDIALAAGHANAVFVPDDSRRRALAARAKVVRRELIQRASALSALGLLEKPRVVAARRGKSNKAVANSIISLADLMRARWTDIEHVSTLRKGELDKAYELGLDLLERLAPGRARGTSDPQDAAEARTRAFTLLARAYDQVRRAVMYLRWDEGDADEIAPSFFLSRGRRRRAASGTSAPLAVVPPMVAGQSLQVSQTCREPSRSTPSCTTT